MRLFALAFPVGCGTPAGTPDDDGSSSRLRAGLRCERTAKRMRGQREAVRCTRGLHYWWSRPLGLRLA